MSSPALRRHADRVVSYVPAFLLLAGSLLFLGAGRHHPVVNASTLGPPGTDAFFRAFAEKMVGMQNWESVHLGILLGPVLWAIGLTAIARGAGERLRPLAEAGQASMLLAAGLWALAFVLDGFAGPRLAQAVLAAPPGNDVAAIHAFSTNLYTMARLGMLSVVLMGGAIVAFSLTHLAITGLRSWRSIVTVTGLGIGIWIASAAAQGEFWPGPFTSESWMMLALTLGLWFLAFAMSGARTRPAA
jgi:hypothetical protein